MTVPVPFDANVRLSGFSLAMRAMSATEWIGNAALTISTCGEIANSETGMKSFFTS